MPHVARPRLAKRHPVHVTLRLERGLGSLRNRRTYSSVRTALALASERFDFCLVQYSVMSNHLHLVCEAGDANELSRGIKGLCVQLARALNRTWNRRGRVFADRFHAHVLRSAREVRNALAYVLCNAAHHGIHLAGLDPCSSAAWFDGWRGGARRLRAAIESPLPHAHTWLLKVGWRQYGLIDERGRARNSRRS